MIDALVKLKDPIPDFSYFAEDQILTADDLNRVIEFLDRQHRMTRSYVIGVGIISGLNVSREPLPRVRVGAGVAITTDGDVLVQREEQAFSHFAPFEDQHAEYGSFRRANNQVFKLWELAPKAVPGFTSLSQFEAQSGNQKLAEMVAVLYLESFVLPEEECTSPDCDRKGDHQIRNLKVLLARREDLAASTVPPANAALDLPVVAAARINLGRTRISRYDGNNGLASRYAAAMKKTKRQLKSVFAKLVVDDSPFREQVREIQGADDWGTLLEQPHFNPSNDTARTQYVYGFYLDLCRAFSEWRDCALELPTHRLPDPDRFAKHIVLGEVETDRAQVDRTRHTFRPSAAVSHGDVANERCYFLLRRIDAMIRSFDASDVSVIRLTPSKSHAHRLGDQAIPYYYADRASTPKPRSIWSFEDRRRGTVAHIPAYHATEDAEASQRAKRPFTFDIARYDFLRIEGHLGKPFAAVQNELEDQARKHNLPFKVVAIQIENEPDRVPLPPRLRFPDLEATFRIQRIDALRTVHAAKDFGEFAVKELDKVGEHENKNEAITHIKKFNTQIKNAIKFLPRSVADFRPQKLERLTANLGQTFEAAKNFQRVSDSIFRATAISPIQNLLDDRRFRNLGLLLEVFEQRKKKVKEQSIFAKFAELHPGLEHLAGTPVGGTFILLYSADDGKVLADFCLPYYLHFDMSTLEPEELDEPKIPPISIPRPRPPLVFEPPFIFEPGSWRATNRLDIDLLRGKKIQEAIDRFGAGLFDDIDVKLDVIENDLIDRLDRTKITIDEDVTRRIATSTAEVTAGLRSHVQDVTTLFSTELDRRLMFSTPVVTFPGSGLDVGGGPIQPSSAVVVDPDYAGVIRSLGVLRATKTAIDSKKALGIALTGEEAALDRGLDSDFADLVIKGSQLESLQGAAPATHEKNLIRTLREVALGIENKSTRRRLVRHFETLGTKSFVAKEFNTIAPSLRRK